MLIQIISILIATGLIGGAVLGWLVFVIALVKETVVPYLGSARPAAHSPQRFQPEA